MCQGERLMCPGCARVRPGLQRCNEYDPVLDICAGAKINDPPLKAASEYSCDNSDCQFFDPAKRYHPDRPVSPDSHAFGMHLKAFIQELDSQSCAAPDALDAGASDIIHETVVDEAVVDKDVSMQHHERSRERSMPRITSVEQQPVLGNKTADDESLFRDINVNTEDGSANEQMDRWLLELDSKTDSGMNTCGNPISAANNSTPPKSPVLNSRRASNDGICSEISSSSNTVSPSAVTKSTCSTGFTNATSLASTSAESSPSPISSTQQPRSVRHPDLLAYPQDKLALSLFQSRANTSYPSPISGGQGVLLGRTAISPRQGHTHATVMDQRAHAFNSVKHVLNKGQRATLDNLIGRNRERELLSGVGNISPQHPETPSAGYSTQNRGYVNSTETRSWMPTTGSYTNHSAEYYGTPTRTDAHIKALENKIFQLERSRSHGYTFTQPTARDVLTMSSDLMDGFRGCHPSTLQHIYDHHSIQNRTVRQSPSPYYPYPNQHNLPTGLEPTDCIDNTTQQGVAPGYFGMDFAPPYQNNAPYKVANERVKPQNQALLRQAFTPSPQAHTGRGTKRLHSMVSNDEPVSRHTLTPTGPYLMAQGSVRSSMIAPANGAQLVQQAMPPAKRPKIVTKSRDTEAGTNKARTQMSAVPRTPTQSRRSAASASVLTENYGLSRVAPAPQYTSHTVSNAQNSMPPCNNLLSSNPSPGGQLFGRPGLSRPRHKEQLERAGTSARPTLHVVAQQPSFNQTPPNRTSLADWNRFSREFGIDMNLFGLSGPETEFNDWATE